MSPRILQASSTHLAESANTSGIANGEDMHEQVIRQIAQAYYCEFMKLELIGKIRSYIFYSPCLLETLFSWPFSRLRLFPPDGEQDFEYL